MSVRNIDSAESRHFNRLGPPPSKTNPAHPKLPRLVGVSKATVHRRIEDGTVKASRVGARYRVGQSEVERYRDWLMDQTAAALADDF